MGRKYLVSLSLFLSLFVSFAYGQQGPDRPDIRPYSPTVGSSIDQISVVNGSPSLNVPIWSLQQRGKLKFDLALHYISPTYAFSTTCLAHGGVGFPAALYQAGGYSTEAAATAAQSASFTPDSTQNPGICPTQGPCPSNASQTCYGGWQSQFTEFGGALTSPGPSSLTSGEGVVLTTSTDVAVSYVAVPNTAENSLYPGYWEARTPDGGVHKLGSVSPGQWRADDGSGWVYNTNTCVLTDNEGTRYSYQCTSSVGMATLGGTFPGYLTSIEDTNGNTITLNYNAIQYQSGNATLTGYVFAGWTDTEGRTISVPTMDASLSVSCPVGSTKSSTWYLPGMPSKPLISCFSPVAYSTDQNLGIWSQWGYTQATGTFAGLTSLILPTGYSWNFSYTPLPGDALYGTQYNYGELTSLQLPTGGLIQYHWAQVFSFCGFGSGQVTSPYRAGVTERDASPDGKTWSKWTYSNPQGFSTANLNTTGASYQTTVIDPLQNKQVHTITNLGFCSFFDTQVAYENSSNAVVRTDQTRYQIIPMFAWSGAYGANNSGLGVLPTSVTTIWPDQTTKSAAYSYDPGFSVTDIDGNSTSAPYGDRIIESYYAYGANGSPGSLLRSTATTYWWQNNSPALTANILTPPASVTVTDAATEVQEITDYGYDESALSSGNASSPGWNSTAPNGSTRGNLTSGSKYLNTTGGYLKTVVTYNNTGTIASITLPSNVPYPDTTTNYGYSSAYQGGLLTSITNALNQTETYTYNAANSIPLSIQDVNRNTTTYNYYPDFRLESIVYPATAAGTAETDYSYPSATEVEESQKQSTSASVNKATYYDGLGRTSSVHLLNACPSSDFVATDTTYDLADHVATVTNPHCGTSTNSSDGTTLHGSMQNGQFVPGYDALGRPTLVTDSDGNSTQQWSYTDDSTTFTDEDKHSWTRTLDALSRLITVQEPGSLLTNYSYDGFDNLTGVQQQGNAVNSDTPVLRSFTYDTLNRLLTSTNPESGELTYSYDAHGNVLTRADARTVSVNYDYDALNRLTGKTYSGISSAAQTIAASTPPSTLTYDSTSITNGIGKLSEEYTGNSSIPVTVDRIVGYDTLGRILGEQECPYPTLCSSSPYVVSYTYDLLGNRSTITNGISTQPITLTYSYDQANRLQTVSSSWADSLHPGTLFQPNSPAPQYGPVGLLNAEFGAASGSSASVYTQQRVYDNRARPTSESDLVGAGSTTAVGTISVVGAEQYVQTPASYATGTVTITGNEGTHQVCILTQVHPVPIMSCRSVPDTGTLSMTINGFTAIATYENGSSDPTVASALAASLNGAGSPVIATPAGNGILMQSRITGTSGNYAYTVSNANGVDFDAVNGSLSGGAAAAQGAGDSGTLSVTVEGVTAKATWTAASTASTIATQLASELKSGAPSSLGVSSSGSTISLTSTSGSSAAITSSVTDSNPTSFPTASFRIEADGLAAIPAGSTVYSYTIPAGGYDPVGNLASVSDSVMGNWTYTYDNLNRLLSAQASATPTGFDPYGVAHLAWSYDDFGNFGGQTLTGSTSAQVTQATYSYAPGTNQLKSSYGCYDASGNLLGDMGVCNLYTYDAEGRIATASGTSGYLYDAEGRRVAKGTLFGSATLPTEMYILDQGGEQLSVVDGQGNWKKSYAYDGNEAFAEYDQAGLHFNFVDWLGTRRAQASGIGLTEETCQSMPYGDSLNCVGASSTTTGLHFTGKQKDPESGLDYFGTRYSNSNMGRWMSPDPLPWLGWQHPSEDASEDAKDEAHEKFENWISNPQNFNLYAYVNNNPLNHTDPTGMAGCTAGDKTFTTCTITITYDPKTSEGTLVVTGQNKGDKDPTVLLTSSVIVGGDGHVTPTGTFTAKSWESNHVSTKYGTWANTPYSKTKLGLNAFGPFQLHMKGPTSNGQDIDARGIYIHGTMGPSWNPFTGLSSLVSPTSHGCVRMCNRDDEALHTLMPNPSGNKVIIKTEH